MSLLTVKQVAARLNVSAACVYGLAERGLLVGYKIGLGRGTWRFDEGDISSFLAAVRSPPVEKEAPSGQSLQRAHGLFERLDGERLRNAWRGRKPNDEPAQRSD